MNILWISHFIPYPPKGGCFQRSFNLIKEVGKRHDVYLVAFRHKEKTHPAGEAGKAETELGKYCRQVHFLDITSRTGGWRIYKTALESLFTKDPFSVSVYKSAGMHRLIRNLVSEVSFDIAHYDTIGLAEYLDDTGNVPKVMTHHGAESFMMRRRIGNEKSMFGRIFFSIEAGKLERYERSRCPRFDMNIVMSELDRGIMRKIAGNATFEIVENGVDVDYFTQIEIGDRKNLIFAGRLDQYSNRDAILWFIEKVWPRVRAMHADATLHVIGMNPPDKLRVISGRDESVKLHGYVDDVRTYFANSMISICPIRDGGGTRIKILDGLAQGIPIVSTSIGCEGIDVTPGKDILVADTDEEFMQQIQRIFDDDKLRNTISDNARKTAENVYSWQIIGTKLIRYYEKLFKQYPPGTERVSRRKSPEIYS